MHCKAEFMCQLVTWYIVIIYSLRRIIFLILNQKYKVNSRYSFITQQEAIGMTTLWSNPNMYMCELNYHNWR